MSRIQGGWTAYNLGLTPSRAHFSHPLRLQCLSTVRWSWQAFWALSKTHNKTKTMQSLAVKSLSSVISIVRTWAHQPSISRIFFYCFLAGFGRSWSQQPHTLSPQEPPVRVEGEFFSWKSRWAYQQTNEELLDAGHGGRRGIIVVFSWGFRMGRLINLVGSTSNSFSRTTWIRNVLGASIILRS